jgi:hypothetical protein
MKKLTLILALAFAGCATTPCPTGATPCPAPADCSTACLHGKNLGCEWATATTLGGACVDVCTNAEQTIPWDVQSLTTATACQ